MSPFPHRGPHITTPDAAAMQKVAAAADELVKGLDAARDAERAYAVALTDPAHQAARAEAEALKEANAKLAAVLGANRQAIDRLAAVQSGGFLRGYAEELRAKQRLARASREESRERLKLEQTMFRRSNPVEQARSALSQTLATERFRREQGRAGLTARLGLSPIRELAEARDRLATDRLRTAVGHKAAAADHGAFLQGDPVGAMRAELARNLEQERFDRDRRSAERDARRELFADGTYGRAATQQARDRFAQGFSDRAGERADLTARAGLSGTELMSAARDQAKSAQMRAEWTERVADAERRIRGEQMASGVTLQQSRERVRAANDEARVRRSERSAERRATLESRFGMRVGGRLAGIGEFAGRPGVAGRLGLACSSSSQCGGRPNVPGHLSPDAAKAGAPQLWDRPGEVLAMPAVAPVARSGRPGGWRSTAPGAGPPGRR